MSREGLFLRSPMIWDSGQSFGTNNLIKQGAIALTKLDDIPAELPYLNLKDLPKIPERYAPIVDAISNGANFLDSIVEFTKLPYNDVVPLLTEMQLRGLVKLDGGGMP